GGGPGRPPVRFLHVRAAHARRGTAREEGAPPRRRHRRRDDRQHLPLRDVPAYPRGDPPRGRAQEGRRAMSARALTRRTLLKGGLVGAGLCVGFRLPGRGAAPADAQTTGVFAPNQWLKIDRDGLVTITNSVPEMGQGSMTTTTIIIADELDADWKKIRVDQAPADPKR